jgi:dephospho-CoA kinase
MHRRIPILGIAGSIGAGKSTVARLLGEMGCVVIDSDTQAKAAWSDPQIRPRLRAAFERFAPDSADAVDGCDRKAIARAMFADAKLRAEVEAIIHPWVAQQRDAVMLQHANDPTVRAFVWDTPLLFEVGLNDACDAIVVVDAPRDMRLARVKASRGWDDGELARREASQWDVSRKLSQADWVVDGSKPIDAIRDELAAWLERDG